MKKIIITLLVFCIFPLFAAPRIDEERMNRDLEIAKSILATQIKSASEGFFAERMIEASYIDGYGVILTIPRSMLYFFDHKLEFDPKIFGFDAPEVNVIIEKDFKRSFKNGPLDEEEVKEFRKNAEKMRSEAEQMREEAQEQREEAMEMSALASAERHERARQFGEEDIEWEEIMITFLADYADVIGQLKPEDKIMVRRESPFREMIIVTEREDDGERVTKKKSAGISAEVTKKDISAYRSGKLTKEEFKDRVTMKKEEPQKKIPDLEMFGSIFKRYYSPDLSKTFFTDGTPRYELLEGFGVIYHIKTYSSYMEADVFSMPTTGQKNVNSEERKAAIEQLYPIFKEDIKDFVLDYGRTIRSLEDDDQLVMKIRLTRCEACNIPEYLELSVKMEDLKAYDQQKMSRDKALAAIEVKEIKS